MNNFNIFTAKLDQIALHFGWNLSAVVGVGQVLMILVGLLLMWLAIKKEMEPTLLLPMGFGAILVNMPGSIIAGETGILTWLYNTGIDVYEVFPLLLFIGIGAMIDFGPLIQKPWLIFVGAAGQGGIFLSMMLASM